MDEPQAARATFFTLGNGLTAGRLVLLPVIMAGITLHVGYLAVAGMAAALVTDLLDGRISRRLGQASAFGGTLDSTVDFVLIYSLFIAFYAAGRLATYQFLVIYLAMLMNLMLQLVSVGGGQMEGLVKTVTGKLTGALQYVYLLFLVAREVLPETQPVEIVNLTLFGLLAAAVAVNTVRCGARLRKLV